MKIVLVHADKKKLSDRIISFFTNTGIRHAALMFPQRTYNALLETSGNPLVGKVSMRRKLQDLGDATITVFEVPEPDAEAASWAFSKLGTEYDFYGILMYPLNRQKRGRLYCFEFVVNALKAIKVLNEKYIGDAVSLLKDGSISGQDIIKIMTYAGQQPEYTGIAKNYF